MRVHGDFKIISGGTGKRGRRVYPETPSGDTLRNLLAALQAITPVAPLNGPWQRGHSHGQGPCPEDCELYPEFLAEFGPGSPGEAAMLAGVPYRGQTRR